MKIPKSQSIVTHYCLHVEELGLEREIDEKRKFFIHGLHHCGIRLTDMEDEIVWSWNVSTRQVSTKLTNDSIYFSCVEYVEKWWHKS